MTATTRNIEDLIEKLRQQESTVVAAHQTFQENVVRQRAGFVHREQLIGTVIATLATAPREIEAGQALSVEIEEHRTRVVNLGTELEQEIADPPDWRLAGDARAREVEYERQETLRQQLRRLRAGALLFAPNQCYRRLEDLDGQLTQSRERIERLQAQLATCVQQADALLNEPVSE